MINNYINIYNNLVELTRNKDLYQNFDKQDTFSDRLIFFLLHFAFFLKVFKKDNLIIRLVYKKDYQLIIVQRINL
jgi:cytochrome b pre-mRNA-processing protein 3